MNWESRSSRLKAKIAAVERRARKDGKGAIFRDFVRSLFGPRKEGEGEGIALDPSVVDVGNITLAEQLIQWRDDGKKDVELRFVWEEDGSAAFINDDVWTPLVTGDEVVVNFLTAYCVFPALYHGKSLVTAGVFFWDDPLALMGDGKLAFEQGRFEEALEIFQKCLRQLGEPDSNAKRLGSVYWDVYFWLADSLVRLDRVDDAISRIQEIAEVVSRVFGPLSSEHLKVLEKLIRTTLLTTPASAAIQSLTALSAQLHKGSGQGFAFGSALLCLGGAFLQLECFKEASKELQLCVGRNGLLDSTGLLEALPMLASALRNTGEAHKAMEHLDRRVKIIERRAMPGDDLLLASALLDAAAAYFDLGSLSATSSRLSHVSKILAETKEPQERVEPIRQRLQGLVDASAELEEKKHREAEAKLEAERAKLELERLAKQAVRYWELPPELGSEITSLFETADSLETEGKFQAAMSTYYEVLRRVQQDGEARFEVLFRLGDCCTRAHQHKDSYRQLHDALELDPQGAAFGSGKHLACLLKLADASLQVRRMDEALDCIKGAVELCTSMQDEGELDGFDPDFRARILSAVDVVVMRIDSVARNSRNLSDESRSIEIRRLWFIDGAGDRSGGVETSDFESRLVFLRFLLDYCSTNLKEAQRATDPASWEQFFGTASRSVDAAIQKLHEFDDQSHPVIKSFLASAQRLLESVEGEKRYRSGSQTPCSCAQCGGPRRIHGHGGGGGGGGGGVEY